MQPQASAGFGQSGAGEQIGAAAQKRALRLDMGARTMLRWPCCAAAMSAVVPYARPVTSASAPRESSSSTIAPWPRFAAISSDVVPYLRPTACTCACTQGRSQGQTHASRAHRDMQTRMHVIIRGTQGGARQKVAHVAPAALTSAPASMSSCATRRCPALLAWQSAVKVGGSSHAAISIGIEIWPTRLSVGAGDGQLWRGQDARFSFDRGLARLAERGEPVGAVRVDLGAVPGGSNAAVTSVSLVRPNARAAASR